MAKVTVCRGSRNCYYFEPGLESALAAGFVEDVDSVEAEDLPSVLVSVLAPAFAEESLPVSELDPESFPELELSEPPGDFPEDSDPLADGLPAL